MIQVVQNTEKTEKPDDTEDISQEFPTDVKIEVIDDSLSPDLTESDNSRGKSSSNDLRKPKLTPLAVQNYLAGLGIPGLFRYFTVGLKNDIINTFSEKRKRQTT